ncbi:MAG: histidine kinase N-terminal 7TM domain-containing protein [Candidatus Omnitrophica bacterium]|nr:histidine kinase N-terminal 7TM domain-containing protein [Candidatus Omnitrophota bacterium]
MTVYSFSSAIAFIICLTLSAFVFFKRRESAQNRFFVFVTLLIGIWCLFPVVTHTITDQASALFWGRVIYLFALVVPAVFLNFILIAIGLNNEKVQRRIVKLAYILFFLFSIVSFNPLFINNIKHMREYAVVVPGPLYHLFVLFFGIMCLYAFYNLIMQYRLAEHSSKNRLRYLLVGFVIAYIGGILHFIPAYIGVEPIPHDILLVMYTLIIFYAIVRHNLMDIEVVIKKTLIFSVFFIVTFGVFVIVTLLTQQITDGKLLGLALSSMIIIITARPIENLLVRLTDKYLFQKKYDYQHVIEIFLDDVITEMNLNKIISRTLELFDKTLRPVNPLIFVRNGVKDRLVAHSSAGEVINVIATMDSPLVEYLKRHKNIVSIEEKTAGDPDTAVVEEMKKNNAILAIPLMTRDDFIGFMLLGKKKSDMAYSTVDMSILNDLARTEAIALKNAEYIDELNALYAEKLQAKVKTELAAMADGMSHQFNNRFMVIAMALGYARNALTKISEGFSDAEKEKVNSCIESVSRAEKSAVTGGEIARGLLNFSRPDKVGFKMVNVAETVDQALQMVEYKHPDFSRLEKIKTIQPGIPLTWANLTYIQEMYFIVFDNAYDAIQSKLLDDPDFKGKIDVSVACEDDKKTVSITVKDNGIGMTSDILEKVKEAIPYVTTKVSSGKSGYGAGVHILKRLVEFHKGRIDYETLYGEGTAVKISMPVCDEPQSA